jgi:hypothetical protein
MVSRIELSSDIKVSLYMENKRTSSKKAKWPDLIAYAEQKLARSRVKTAQLEAIIATFRAQAESGEPCPTELSALELALSKQLQ